MKGIDVSSYQGVIDWSKVRTDFAIIRMGYGDDISRQDDSKFMSNVQGCILNNIPFAVYLYSYAVRLEGEESIRSEVNHCLRLLNGISKKPFCVYLDMEDDSTTYLGRDMLTKMAIMFCSEIGNAGYKTGVYANEYWYSTYLKGEEIASYGNSLWVAKYGNNKPEVRANYDIWQYTSKGKIEGIQGDVDLNEMFNDIRDVDNDAGDNVSDSNVSVYYRVKTLKYGWLPEVVNLSDYAGYNGDEITGLAMRVDKGSMRYRVHIKGGSWLPYVTGYDISEGINGYAGDGKRVIDAVEAYYDTPNDIRPYKKIKYRVNDYPYQYDNETSDGQDGYAGVFGVSVTKFQAVIE